MIPITEWRTDIAALLKYWKANDGRRVHCVNGLNPSSVTLYPPMVGMVENAFGSSSMLLPSATKWQAHARLVCDAQTKGWTPWVFCKMHSQDANCGTSGVVTCALPCCCSTKARCSLS